MNSNQLILSIAGLLLTQTIAILGFIKYYIDAKIDPVSKQVDLLVQYMIQHEGKIAKLEERNKL